MKTNLYSVTVPVYKKMLGGLSTVLDKAEAHAAGNEAALEHLMTDRLYADMFPFSQQVEVACDNAKNSTARLAGIEAPVMADGTKTVAELKARVEATIAFLNTVNEEDFAEAEERKIELKYFPGKPMGGFGYATEYAIPNFYFHLVTAYAILRHNGVLIGKQDYITSLPFLEAGAEA
jgi:hypothetical protein